MSEGASTNTPSDILKSRSEASDMVSEPGSGVKCCDSNGAEKIITRVE